MTDENETSPWAPPGDAGSSLPPPVPPVAAGGFPSSPPPAPPTPSIYGPSPVAPDDTPIDMTFVEPAESGATKVNGRWLGRGLAAAGAAVLIGGGGYLALGAGTDDGGADTPEGAVEQLFSALSSEDLVGVAELVEPSERATIVAAGFDIADELVRLEVLADDLDLGSLSGLDLEFDDLVLRTEQVSSDVANVEIDGGVFTASYEADELPFGPLVLDRVPDDWLASSDSVSEPMVDPDIVGLGRDAAKITTVQRDGRWYVSLWYSVAENGRAAADMPFPDADERLVAIGSDSPEAAVRRLVDEAERLDVRQVLRLLDPEEARAIHDYAPLFLDDAEQVVADVLREADYEGVQWDVHTLELHTDNRGDRATVIFDEIGFTLESGELSVQLDATTDSFVLEVDEVLWDGDRRRTSVVFEDGCTTATWEDDYDSGSDRMCADDMFDEFGLSSSILGNAAGGVLTPSTGIETHRVGGEWYISPTMSVSQPMLSVMRAWEPEDLADLVDAFVEFAEDPFGEDDFSFDTGGDFSFDEPSEAMPMTPPEIVAPPDTVPLVPELVPTTTFGPGEDPYVYVPANVDLLDPSIGSEFSYDLFQDDAAFEFDIWLPGTTAPTFVRGVYAEIAGADGTVVVMVVEIGGEAEAAAALAGVAEIAGAVPREVAGVSFVQTADSYGDPVLVAVDGSELVVIGTYAAELSEQEAVLVRQVTG